MMKKFTVILSIVLVWSNPGEAYQTCGCEIEDLKRIIEEEIHGIFETKKAHFKGEKGDEG